MLFIVRIGLSGFAPYSISSDEEDFPTADALIKGLEEKALSEFSELAREKKIDPVPLVGLVAREVRKAVASRTGLHEVRAIDPQTLQPMAPNPDLVGDRGYYIELMFLTDEVVAKRDAFIEKIFNR